LYRYVWSDQGVDLWERDDEGVIVGVLKNPMHPPAGWKPTRWGLYKSNPYSP
jgi:hypothetical protein